MNEILPTAQRSASSSTAIKTPDGKSHHFDVAWLQQSLNTLIDARLAVDGKMGPATTDAIKRFQTKAGLDPDGWAGMLTLAAIEDELRTARR
jgi:peptidoglycan hydrolase-like protein with peptidoglycan-binding domain